MSPETRPASFAEEALRLGGKGAEEVRRTGAVDTADDQVESLFAARYRTMPGQTYGWDCVIAAGSAWFLDDGDGSERYTGTLRSHGLSTAPLHLVRVDLTTGEYLTQWLDHMRGRVRATTYEGYESLVRMHALPGIGEVPLAGLHPLQVQGLYADLLSTPRAGGRTLPPSNTEVDLGLSPVAAVFLLVGKLL